jgi:hypothetical protein
MYYLLHQVISQEQKNNSVFLLTMAIKDHIPPAGQLPEAVQ